MSDDFLPYNTQVQRNTFVRRLIVGAYRRGDSAASILRAFRAIGGKIANNTFSRLTGEAREIVKHENDLRSLDPSQIVPASYFTTLKSLNVKSRFIYEFDVAYITKGGTDVFYETYAIGSQDWLSTDQAAVELYDKFSTSDYIIVGHELIGTKAAQGVF